MAHYAKLDNTNTVTHVVRVEDNECVDANGIETDNQGQNFLRFIHKEPDAVWKRCSYNTVHGEHQEKNENGDVVAVSTEKAFRGNYPTVGYTYDEALDIFLSPKPYPSWLLHTERDWAETGFDQYEWKPPVEYPSVNKKGDVLWFISWDEPNQRWTAYLADDNEVQYVWNESTKDFDVI
jgi:hypothetical protein